MSPPPAKLQNFSNKAILTNPAGEKKNRAKVELKGKTSFNLDQHLSIDSTQSIIMTEIYWLVDYRFNS